MKDFKEEWKKERETKKDVITKLQNLQRMCESLKAHNNELNDKLKIQNRTVEEIKESRRKDLEDYKADLKKKTAELNNEKQLNQTLNLELAKAQLDAKNFESQLSFFKKVAYEEKNAAKRKIEDLIESEKNYIKHGKKLKEELAVLKERENTPQNVSSKSSPTVTTPLTPPPPSPPTPFSPPPPPSPQTSFLPSPTTSPASFYPPPPPPPIASSAIFLPPPPPPPPKDDIFEYYIKNKDSVTQQMKKITGKRPDLHIKTAKMDEFICGIKRALERKVVAMDVNKPPPMNIREYYKVVSFKMNVIKPMVEKSNVNVEILRTFISYIEEAARMLELDK